MKMNVGPILRRTLQFEKVTIKVTFCPLRSLPEHVLKRKLTQKLLMWWHRQADPWAVKKCVKLW